jgi:arginyl-tRNA synthetase
MNIFIKEIIDVLKEKVNLSPEELEKVIEIPPEEKMGDYAFPCFILSKKLKKPPDKIANELSGKLKPKELVEKIYSIGPYVNFKVNKVKLAQEVFSKIFEQKDSYGGDESGKGKTMVIEFSSPNIAKPFGVGHLRSTVIGNAIYNLYKHLGYKCIRLNHLGDWGTQFGTLIVAYKKWGDEKKLKSDPINTLYDLYVKFHQESERNPDLEDEARLWFKKLEQKDKETTDLWKRFKDYSIKEFQRIYQILGIEFDSFAGESFYDQFIDSTIEKIKKAGLTKISQDALIVDLEKYDLPACLLRKKDGATLYATRDITAAIYRYDTYHFEKLLYVVGSAQKLHFQQVFKVLKLMGYSWTKDLAHVDFGWILFKEKVMSTRKGSIVLLEDVLNRSVDLALKIIQEKNPELEDKEKVAFDVGIGAVIFADLSTRRQKDVNFDWEEVLNFEGQSGPYIQYTHARLCSLMRKYGKSISNDVDFKLLRTEEENLIAKRLLDYPRQIKMAAESYEPSIICSYLLDLCAIFNRFYQKERIITANQASTQARMILVKGVQTVVKNGLALLGIKAPERM